MSADNVVPINGYIKCNKCGTTLPAGSQHDCEAIQFQRVISRLAAIDAKMDKIDTMITNAANAIEAVRELVEPMIDKLSKNPIIKGLIS